ncbi:MAG: GNAT family N-acetyltransferase [Ahniella sp.]|nr:GNAT family N-acetyltransferase [Ahniella sp.]
MKFVYLAERMNHAPRLAAAHYREWGPLLPDWSESEALAELESHQHRCAVPTTILGIDESSDEDQLIGSVSLLANDHEQIRAYSPWLASLYVWPAYRGQGHGVALVQRCLAEARALGLPKIYLYTAGQQVFYRKLGWRDTTIP